MEFPQAVRTCLKDKYVNFSGRASRSEYWYFYLFYIVCYVIASCASMVSQALGSYLTLAVCVALCLPSLGAAARRLHDIDKSGWFLLFALVPVLGWIYIIVLLCRKGTEGANRFGAQPDA